MRHTLFILALSSTVFSIGRDTLTAYFDQPTTFEEYGMFGEKKILTLEQRYCETVIASSTLEEGSLKYAAKNLIDGSSKTAWAEGGEGNGVGEELFFEFRKLRDFYTGCPDIIEIVPGYGKSSKIWRQNSRLLAFDMTLLNVDKEEDYPVEAFHV